MTTPIERGAEAVLENFHGPDNRHSTWHLNPNHVARAVFESIDVEGLARASYVADYWGVPDAGENWDRLALPPHIYDRYRVLATAIKAHLLEGGE